MWCALRGVQRLALAPLAHNPFPDASDAFFADLESALNRGLATRISIERPFARLTKKQVMELGADLPLRTDFLVHSPGTELALRPLQQVRRAEAGVRGGGDRG